ncbi:MAG: AAA family ATPase, partial [Phycisphaerae bacterium]
ETILRQLTEDLLLDLGYPDAAVEVDILRSHSRAHPLEKLDTVLTQDEVHSLQQRVVEVQVDESISQYIVLLVQATRNDPRLKLGVSPRGSLMLCRAAQAAAFSDGRDFVLPDDIQRLAPYVLGHRIIMTPKSRYDGTTKTQVIRDVLKQVKVPT